MSENIIDLSAFRGDKHMLDAQRQIAEMEQRLTDYAPPKEQAALEVLIKIVTTFKPNLENLNDPESIGWTGSTSKSIDDLFPDWEANSDLSAAVIAVGDFMGNMATQHMIETLRGFLQEHVWTEAVTRIWKKYPECKTYGDLVKAHKPELQQLYSALRLQFAKVEGES
jgi:hypothetical protein